MSQVNLSMVKTVTVHYPSFCLNLIDFDKEFLLHIKRFYQVYN